MMGRRRRGRPAAGMLCVGAESSQMGACRRVARAAQPRSGAGDEERDSAERAEPRRRVYRIRSGQQAKRCNAGEVGGESRSRRRARNRDDGAGFCVRLSRGASGQAIQAARDEQVSEWMNERMTESINERVREDVLPGPGREIERMNGRTNRIQESEAELTAGDGRIRVRFLVKRRTGVKARKEMSVCARVCW